ncbi:hypothetical protein KFE25_000073 [Diacronema lutheri]|uniref:Uncharacterized protein n=1 Tax=Diacronema lutheri TaxID=2081491 RepID=A0A8J5XII5_DIALT|nr:hypothetical protein KFE25_000073 [Diacronema lutheri]
MAKRPGACCGYRLTTDWRLFLKKSLFVVVLSYALVPLIAFKQSIPAALFTVGLVVLHVLILVVYVYRVRIRQLDPDWRAFSARIVAIGFALWLLDLATKLEGGKDVAKLCANMLVLCAAHCFVLALLTVRVVRAAEQPLLPLSAVPAASASEPLVMHDSAELPLDHAAPATEYDMPGGDGIARADVATDAAGPSGSTAASDAPAGEPAFTSRQLG